MVAGTGCVHLGEEQTLEDTVEASSESWNPIRPSWDQWVERERQISAQCKKDLSPSRNFLKTDGSVPCKLSITETMQAGEPLSEGLRPWMATQLDGLQVLSKSESP